ncbi:MULTISPECIES: SURF1 family protein [unclassified Paracoccus (in: a-proteobacteria)]|uniref:SURF1 family protein n=1 Tax=unclassified Paracoccus (in: a-proteobacteria) TaxID=2688777 RepID=UPI0021E180CF|nr:MULTISPECIES: SURF1 family protein [unclassified Paracoccus (in: a-proteobacteria)]UXU76614.1 SURF1 family protein [Paracoccus sp. SMMA_5]UXU82501.1 SURF1 family protein [Paracoccus sp. SMMA_5_TC]
MIRPWRRLALAGAALAVLAGLILLGLWQLQRLEWKTALIARVEAQLAAPVQPAPGPEQWPRLGPDDEYRRISVSGHYRTDSDILVKAVTARGAGFWVMTPLDTAQGWVVLVNRGFVPQDDRDTRPLPPGPVTVQGLLRASQPGGAFLRRNDPGAGRWFSRDVAAMAAQLGLGDVAPYFIDAEAGPPGTRPIGGLTVLGFRNPHLGYALTWFALAALWAGGLVLLARRR